MSDLTLVIGNKNYSSWSLRPWLAMKANGISFAEEVIPLDVPEFAPAVARYSAAGQVPILLDGEITVWDSLAICEHLADRFPKGRHWWPQAAHLRAHARSAVAEMHAGFSSVRKAMPMNLKRTPKPVSLNDAAKTEIARIETLWTEALSLSGGPFLYGDFSIADAFYAPIATRFQSYAVSLSEQSMRYVAQIHKWPDFLEWRDAGLKEPWSHDSDAL